MRFLHPDNQDKEWVDWRLPENRREMFFRWFNWRLSGKNIDHYTWNLAYMNTSASPTGKPMTRAQKLWFSYLFGTTYQSSMAWTYYWHFPDPMAVDLDDLDEWNRANMYRQKFATDTRYNKGHLVKMWSSLQDWVNKQGNGDIEKAFDSLVDEDEAASFWRVFDAIRGLVKFGKMTTWLACQCLYECAELPIEPGTMFLWDPEKWSDFRYHGGGNVSVWNGMCYLEGLDYMTVGGAGKFADYRPTSDDRHRIKSLERELMAESREKIQERRFLSYYTLETHLCQFKKLNVGGDYPGQNVGDAVERYQFLKEAWPEVDYSAFAKAVDSDDMFEVIRWRRESKGLMKLFKLTGQPIHMQNLFPDLPDMAKELALPEGYLLEEGDENMIRDRISSYQEALNGCWLSESVFQGLY